ncbi:hypothetical protein, partial [Halorubrum pallidum]
STPPHSFRKVASISRCCHAVLRLAKDGCGLGVMTHANVSPNVEDFIRDFPASGNFYDRNDGFEYDDESRYLDISEELTSIGQEIRNETIRFVDSGAFLKEGSQFESYEELFNRYEAMDADYGIIIDKLNNSDETVSEAIDAMNTYEDYNYNFNLVGVAQGTDVDEYLDCFDQLQDLGYDHVAVGGLLKKAGERSGAFAHVDSDEYMEAVLRRIREHYEDEWLFALGCYHPERHELFEDLDLFGADYKGWVYKYKSQYNNRRKARDWRFRSVRSFIKHNTTTGTNSAENLLILPCSNGKINSPGRLPSEKRYCGQFFQTYDKWRGETKNPKEQVDLLIYSAKYGLIQGEHLIQDYDSVLSGDLSEEKLEQLGCDLYTYLKYRSYNEIFCCGGEDYRKPIENVLRTLKSREITDAPIVTAEGKIGIQLSKLKEWLNDEPSIQSGRRSTFASVD